MKALTLAIALAVGSTAATAPVLIAPAFAQTGKSEHGWKVGDLMPSNYTRLGRYAIDDTEQYDLPAAPVGFEWLLVGETAYLINSNNDRIVTFRKVEKAEG